MYLSSSYKRTGKHGLPKEYSYAMSGMLSADTHQAGELAGRLDKCMILIATVKHVDFCAGTYFLLSLPLPLPLPFSQSSEGHRE